jgi:hypothetical protein
VADSKIQNREDVFIHIPEIEQKEAAIRIAFLHPAWMKVLYLGELGNEYLPVRLCGIAVSPHFFPQFLAKR